MGDRAPVVPSPVPESDAESAESVYGPRWIRVHLFCLTVPELICSAEMTVTALIIGVVGKRFRYGSSTPTPFWMRTIQEFGPTRGAISAESSDRSGRALVVIIM